jgi:putative IMPACT (imprinted ancient) family translation regulator
VLLGKGGLIQAYGSTAAMAIQNATISEMDEMTEQTIHVQATAYPVALDQLKKFNAKLLSQKWEINCEIRFMVSKDQLGRLMEKLLPCLI